MKEKDISSLDHTTWRCQYHVVFAPKYRRLEIYGAIKADIGKILRQLCQQKGVEIIEAEACPDHNHMLLSIPPKYSVSQIMGYLKGKSSLMIFDRHANLKYKYGNRHFWARGYYVDTVASGFCIFFGGTFTDSFCAALCGLVIGLIAYLFEKVNTNLFFHKITAAFFMALCAYLLNALHLVHAIDAVIAGSLMLLVPGLLFTNATRDIIYGDTNSGINRMVEVLLIAAAIALGVAAAWHTAVTVLPPQPFSPALTHSPTITILASFLACSGFVLVFNVHGWGKVLCALGGAITWAAYCLADYAGGSSVLCFFIATIVATIFSEIMARIRKYPATSYLVISLLPLIPGAGIYYAAHQAVQSNLSGFLSYSTNTLSTAGALAVGILVVTSVIRLWHDRTIHSARPTKTEK